MRQEIGDEKTTGVCEVPSERTRAGYSLTAG